jgi:hypothetical protein
MSQNSTPSYLDSPQIIKRVYEEADDALRVKVASGTDFDVALSYDDGDSVGVQGNSVSTKASLTSASTGVVVAAFDCSGMKSFNLYTKTITTITSAQVLTLEVSPSATDDVWKATALTITPDTTADVVVMGTTLTSVVAKRARVSIAAAISAGTFDVYVVRQGV